MAARHDHRVPERRADWLPDFCSPPIVFSLLVLAAATVLVVQLAPGVPDESALLGVPLALVFVSAAVFLVVVSLCVLRPYLVRLSTPLAVLGTYAVVVVGAALGSLLSYWLDHALALGATIPPGQIGRFVAGNIVVAAITWGVALRHFYVRGQWQRQVEAHAQTQFDALQARIRPHFLFNSMNTIASLVRDRPDEAERAIEDLSELFRVALRAGTTTTLEQELDLVRRYVAIEKLRLGDRLDFREALSNVRLDLAVPALLLQPLVENAILHGIQHIEAGGTVDLSVQNDPSGVVISVRNPLAPQSSKLHRGSGTALENIRQRVLHRFGEDARLEVERTADYHLVRLVLPAR